MINKTNVLATIMIVDNIFEEIQILSKILTRSGYKVRCVKSGKEALESINDILPDLILLDVKMPELDGYEVFTILKKNEKTANIPVLFLSGLNESGNKIRAFEVGGVDFITKPFKNKEIILRIKSHLEIRDLYLKLENVNKELQIELDEHKKQKETTNKINRLYSILYNIDETIVKIHDKKLLFNEICRIAFSNGNFLMSWIGIINKDNKVDVVASAGFTEDYLNKINIDLNDEIRSNGPTGRAIKSGHYAFSNDIINDPTMNPWKKDAIRLGYNSSASFPFKISEKVIGSITIYSNEVGFFTQDEIKLIEKLASNLSFAIEFIENEEVRKKTEKSLLESKAHIKLISNNFTSGMIYQLMIKPDGSRKFTYLSNSVKQLYGITPEEGMLDANLIYSKLNKDDIESLMKIEAESIKNLSIFKVEIRIKDIFGNERWSYLVSTPILMDDGVIFFDGIEFIITDRKLTENIIKAHLRINEFAFNHSLNELLQKILDEVCNITNSTIGFYHFVETDQKTISLQAWSTNTIKNYYKATCHESNYNLDNAGIWADCIREKKAIIHNNYELIKNKKEVPEGYESLVREIVVPIIRDGLIVAIIGVGNKVVEYNEKDLNLVSYFADIAWEITQKKLTDEKILKLNEELEERVIKRTEELANSNKELESFSYSVSHDLRAPLRAIDGFSNILIENYSEKLGSEGERLLNKVIDSSKKMSSLINDILAFSRTNRKEIHRSEIDMKFIVESIYNEITSEEEKSKINFSVTDLPKTNADEPMIKQIWTNLISNAIKFTSKIEKPKIEIDFKKEEDKNIYFITDNGIGFDMNYAYKLFGVFQRLHSESEFKGTGVGLAIVKSIISKHSGKIWVNSEPNIGSSFYFYL